ncbi:MAG: SDR family oxidoreductase [Candidatus Thermoplasmatota archaeon]|nr:SDR family oxidoreductase [Candidatus Thermoplasmatota archaeon]
MRVGITGAAGYFGRNIIARLEENDSVDHIVGISRRPWEHGYEKLDYHRLDVRSDTLPKLFASQGVDTVIHLAFALNPTHDKREMHDINVNGTRNVLAAAAEAGIQKLMMSSSTTVYGALPDNPSRLTEDMPRRGRHSRYYYPRDKVRLEEQCEAWKKNHPEVIVTTLRPCLVMGPTVDQYYSRLFTWRMLPLVSGANPEIQFIHQDDVARAFEHFTVEDIGGVFNIVGDGTMRWRDIITTAGIRPVSVPRIVLSPLMSLAWRLRLIEMPPAMLDFIQHPWVAAGDKAKKAGFTPRYSTRETLAAFLKEKKNF